MRQVRVQGDDKKTKRAEILNELLQPIEIEPDFLDNVITGDEMRAFQYVPKKGQTSEWHTDQSPKPKKARMSKSKVKAVLMIFFYSKGVVHKDRQTPPTMWMCWENFEKGSSG